MNPLKPDKIPVLLCGMWPSSVGDPESGARVLIHKGVGEPELLTGFSDENGEFRGLLSSELAGENVRVVISEPSFLYDSYDSIKVERWGLFLPIRARRDHVYIGSEGARSINPVRWNNWNESSEFAHASEKTHAAARRAKIAWPLGYIGVLVAVILGLITIPLNPILALFVAIIVATVFSWFSKWLLEKGY